MNHRFYPELVDSKKDRSTFSGIRRGTMRAESSSWFTLRFVFLGLLLIATGIPLHGHQSSDSFLLIDRTSSPPIIHWEIAVRDLDLALELDEDSDGAVTWGELSAQRSELERFAVSRTHVHLDGAPMALRMTNLQVVFRESLAFTRLSFEVHGDPSRSSLSPGHEERWSFGADLLGDLDTQHRTLARAHGGGFPDQLAVLSPSHPVMELDVEKSTRGARWGSVLWHGVEHIVTGVDHVLFLVALLLPGVMRFRAGEWRGADSWRGCLGSVARVVTAFTVAHSITFVLASIGWVRLPSKGVESVIALSVVVASVNNLRPFLPEHGSWMPFGFGLIHGFGFAGPLEDLGLRGWELGEALLGFNLGVELGQLGIALLVLPVAFTLRFTQFYRRFTLPVGSAFIACVALVWLAERLLEKKWLPV